MNATIIPSRIFPPEGGIGVVRRVDISPKGRMWTAYFPGRVVFGNGHMRPAQIIGDKMFHTSLLPPGDPPVVTKGSAGLLVGTVRVVAVYYRKISGERSLAGPASDPVSFTGQQITLSLEDIPDDPFVSNMEFYANVEEIGGWYRIGSTPYTEPLEQWPVVTVDMSAETLVSKRPLEDQMQTSLYPGVSTATAWNGALYGARLLGREFNPGTVITLVNGSSFLGIAGDNIHEADRYKPLIVNGEILLYVYDRRSFKLPGSTSTSFDVWNGPTISFNSNTDEMWIGSEEQTVYVSPTYVGEEGNGITRGLVTWNPLNQLRDEYQASIGSRIMGMIRSRESLYVFFDKAIVQYQGEPGFDVPTPRAVTISESIGAVGHHHIWTIRDGSVWWLTRSRIFTLQGSEVVDYTQTTGNASLVEKQFGTDYSQNFYNWTISYNPETNQTLIANIAERGASADPDRSSEMSGTQALLIDHTRNAFYRLSFPVRLKTLTCIPRQDGRWAWYSVAVPVEDVPEGVNYEMYFCSLMKPTGGLDSVGAQSLEVSWSAVSGIKNLGVHGIPVSERMTVVEPNGLYGNSDIPFYRTQAMMSKGSFVPERWDDQDVTLNKVVTSNDMRNSDWVAYQKAKPGTSMQHKWSGSTASATRPKIVGMTILYDIVPLRGFDE